VSDADVIIIGAGIAGISLGAELCETRTVCVIEAEDYPAYRAGQMRCGMKHMAVP
jgi:L-2-hydroxyglutarate oxidase LhgO